MSGDGDVRGERVDDPFIDAPAERFEMRAVLNQAIFVVVFETFGEAHRIAVTGVALLITVGEMGGVRAGFGRLSRCDAIIECVLSSISHD